MENRVLKYDHRMQDYVGRDTNGYMSFYGVVRDNDAAAVEDAVVMLFACFNDGAETKLGYTLTNGEGAYFLCLPEMSDHTRLTGFKVRAGKATIFPDGYGQLGESTKVDTFLIDPSDANRDPADENSNTLVLGSTLMVVPPTVQASTVTINRPEAPKGLKAVAANHRQVNLSWNAVSGAALYKVYRSRSQAGAGTGTMIGTAKKNAFSDKDLVGTAGYLYNWYKVTAVNSAGEGGFSKEVSIGSRAYLGPFF